MRILLVLVSLSLFGCATAKLWNGTSENEYVKIIPENPEEDVEVALKERGREYECKVLYYSRYPNNKICYMKITENEKKESFRIKFMKTPEAIVTDAGTTIKVIGSIFIRAVLSSGYHN